MIVLVLTLVAVVATDVAVGILYLTMRRQTAAPLADLEPSLAAEMEELVSGVRDRAEQAGKEIARQKAQLRRMLDELEGVPATRPMTSASPRSRPTREQILDLAAEGHSLRAIAGQTGISLEEARLLLAADGPALATA